MNPLPLHFVIKTNSHAHMEVKVGMGPKIFNATRFRALIGTTVVAIITFFC